jgi:hypothetical protein
LCQTVPDKRTRTTPGSPSFDDRLQLTQVFLDGFEIAGERVVRGAGLPEYAEHGFTAFPVAKPVDKHGLAPIIPSGSCYAEFRMTQRHLKELIAEIEASLQSDAITPPDRAMLEQVHADLTASLIADQPAPGLRNTLNAAIERLENEHPQLTTLLAKALDVLSDVGL